MCCLSVQRKKKKDTVNPPGLEGVLKHFSNNDDARVLVSRLLQIPLRQSDRSACGKTMDLSPGKEPSERITMSSTWQSVNVRIVPVPSATLKNFTTVGHWLEDSESLASVV